MKKSDRKKKRQSFTIAVGQLIREKRHDYDWTQERLAEEANMDEKHLGRIENGVKSPSGFTLYTLLTVLNIPLSAITEEINKMKEDEQ